MRRYDYPLRVIALGLIAGVLCFVVVNPGSVVGHPASMASVHALDQEEASAAPADAPQVDAFAQVVQIAKMCRGILVGAMLLVSGFVLRYVLLTATRGSSVLQRIVGNGGRVVLLKGCVNRC
ncbi:hypothetical protein FZI91_09825 [Mycobacterium sp. CBMA271]|uniref:hypothetical protein n=1 Tax=unclassified Mycobacteroides TaxID=2618759 RepID=UPI0012DFA0D4|nr:MULTISPECIES: hypothetical protein [unclassified Mycobacteroides]MUM15727.1 hypothetical protein [Mycobacteroides sp. CBMA 326]MUM17522.1 hypothetical protein [Mycobacteroides sp. CBMA 326]MUM21999.1 hypothetical protein [Mycobacteroides sp. CBMA 271]